MPSAKPGKAEPGGLRSGPILGMDKGGSDRPMVSLITRFKPILNMDAFISCKNNNTRDQSSLLIRVKKDISNDAGHSLVVYELVGSIVTLMSSSRQNISSNVSLLNGYWADPTRQEINPERCSRAAEPFATAVTAMDYVRLVVWEQPLGPLLSHSIKRQSFRL